MGCSHREIASSFLAHPAACEIINSLLDVISTENEVSHIFDWIQRVGVGSTDIVDGQDVQPASTPVLNRLPVIVDEGE